MEKIAEKTFTAELVKERSITPTLERLGEYKSTMTLYKYLPIEYHIEWNIPELEETIDIGIWVNEDKKVMDYDGVFSLPSQAIKLLNENGFDTREVE